jgi:hypothetical protein
VKPGGSVRGSELKPSGSVVRGLGFCLVKLFVIIRRPRHRDCIVENWHSESSEHIIVVVIIIFIFINIIAIIITITITIIIITPATITIIITRSGTLRDEGIG